MIRTMIAMLVLSWVPAGAWAQKVEYSFTATKVGATAPATAFRVGDEIDVVLYVRDLRPVGTWYGTRTVNNIPITKNWPMTRGVYAAYADVVFDGSVLVLESAAFNQAYPNGIHFTAFGGYFDDVGAFTKAGEGGLDTSKKELMRWRFRCAWGDTDIQCYFDSIKSPEYDTLVFASGNVYPPDPKDVRADKSEIMSVPLTISVR